MSKQSSCIAIFSSFSEASAARQTLKNSAINNQQIVLLDKDLKEAPASTNIHNYFNQISVPEDTMHCYLCLLHSGSLLLITSGTSQEIELAYQILEKKGFASSIHFNANSHN